MSRKRRNSRKRQEHRPLQLGSFPRKEFRRGAQWFVRDINQSAALKIYRCPGCGNDIPVHQAHLVVWQADHFFGDEYSVGERRHWHIHCWKQF